MTQDLSNPLEIRIKLTCAKSTKRRYIIHENKIKDYQHCVNQDNFYQWTEKIKINKMVKCGLKGLKVDMPSHTNEEVLICKQ